MIFRASFLIVVVLLAAPRARASEVPLVTDRPDVAESSETVGHLRLQFEMGVDFAQASDGAPLGVRTPSKIRFGLSDSFEVHLESDALSFDGLGEDSMAVGMSDLDIGGKVHLLDGKGVVPSVGLLLSFTMPIGAPAEFASDTFSGHPTFAFEWEGSGESSIALNLGASIPFHHQDINDPTFRWAVAVGSSLSFVSQSLGSYVEYFGEASFETGSVGSSLDGGFTYLLTSSLQLDLNIRVGLTSNVDVVGGGLGVSFRI